MKRKLILTSCVITSVVVIAATFLLIDINLAKKDKNPIFYISKFSISSFNVDIESSESEDKYNQYIYTGLGYKLLTCDNCDYKAKIFPIFSDVNKYISDELICSNHDKTNSTVYNFKNNKLDYISNTEIIAEKNKPDLEKLKSEVEEFNNIDRCYSDIVRKENNLGYTTYVFSKGCYIDEISESLMPEIYNFNKKDLNKNKKEIIKLIKNNTDMHCK